MFAFILIYLTLATLLLFINYRWHNIMARADGELHQCVNKGSAGPSSSV